MMENSFTSGIQKCQVTLDKFGIIYSKFNFQYIWWFFDSPLHIYIWFSEDWKLRILSFVELNIFKEEVEERIWVAN